MFKPSALWQEFKAFAFKGNLIDLAVAVVLGKAFGDLIGSLVKNIVMPIVSVVTPNPDYTQWKFRFIAYGAFLGDLLNFLVIALAIFIFMVKLIGALMSKAKPAPAPSEPVVKECPFCLSTIPLKATKCAHCTGTSRECMSHSFHHFFQKGST